MRSTTARRPKVCIIQYNASRFLTRVDRSARTLAQAGCDVVLVGIRDEHTTAFEERDGYIVRRVTLRSRGLPRRFGLRSLRFIEAIAKTFMAAWREDADVYNPRDIYPLLVAHWAAGLRRARVVYDSDELNLDRNWPYAQKAWWRVLASVYERHYARKSDAVITSDEGRADILAERYGIERPTVALNVPDLIERPESDEEFRSTALEHGDRLLIYTGGLVPNRGLHELVDALGLLDSCSLAIVGFGHLEDALKAHVLDQGLHDRITFFDAVPFERLMSLTASADVGIVPIEGVCLSYVHAAPNKLFEYMMAGLPVVASDLPDMAAIVRAERCGVLIEDPSDPRSIASAVRRVLDRPDEAEEMGRRGREAVLRRYNWAHERDRVLAVYERIGVLDAKDPEDST